LPWRAGAWLAPAPGSSVILGSNVASSRSGYTPQALCLSRNPLRRRGCPPLPTSSRTVMIALLDLAPCDPCRRLPRFLGASSLHRSRCEFALGVDANPPEVLPSRAFAGEWSPSYATSPDARNPIWRHPQRNWTRTLMSPRRWIFLHTSMRRATAGVMSTAAGLATSLPNWSSPLL
jgi:hypothetical protein